MKRTILAASLAAAMATTLGALEIKDGLMKVILHEDSGRFTVYYLADAAKARYEPLLFDRDPRTSSVNVYIDGRLYRMGESTDFRIGSRKNGGGADFVFKSPACTVTQNFAFMKSKGSSLTDAVRITVTVENSSDKDLSVGTRVILDSHLGETITSHFSTNLRPRIATETRIDASTRDEWVSSAPSGSGKPGLLLPMPASGLTRADGVILANWSRLNSSPWDFELGSSRNFTLQPYSINDSAIALDWRAEKLRGTSSRTCSFILAGSVDSGSVAFASKTSAAGPAFAPADPSTAAPAETGTPSFTATSNVSDRWSRAKADYLALGQLIARIDALIASGLPATEAEIAELRAALKELEAAKSRL